MSGAPIRVLVAGCGHMGAAHARAYHEMPDFEIAGLVSRGADSRGRLNAALGGGHPEFDDLVSILGQERFERENRDSFLGDGGWRSARFLRRAPGKKRPTECQRNR